MPLATPLGLHLEGPFLAPERRGAHDPAWLRPPPSLGPGPAGASGPASVAGPGSRGARDPAAGGPEPGRPGLVPPTHTGAEDLAAGGLEPGLVPPAGPAPAGAEDLASEAAGWSREAGVALVTLAPELPGALDLVRALAGRGVVVSAGHSSATAAQAEAAIDAGVRYVTHLFNAMAPLHHREPGLAGVALTDDRVTVGLIADGIHVDARAVRLAARALGPRLSLVTDAVAAQGLAEPAAVGRGAGNGREPGGRPRLGRRRVAVGDGGDVRLADGTLAGSTLTLDRAVRNAQEMAGLDLAAAVGAVTAVPAAVLGLSDRGAIVDGDRGDLVVLDDAGEVVATVIGGRVAYARGEAGARTR